MDSITKQKKNNRFRLDYWEEKYGVSEEPLKIESFFNYLFGLPYSSVQEIVISRHKDHVKPQKANQKDRYGIQKPGVINRGSHDSWIPAHSGY